MEVYVSCHAMHQGGGKSGVSCSRGGGRARGKHGQAQDNTDTRSDGSDKAGDDSSEKDVAEEEEGGNTFS